MDRGRVARARGASGALQDASPSGICLFVEQRDVQPVSSPARRQLSVSATAAPEAPERRLLARSLKTLGKIYAQAFHHLEVLTPCRLPKRGPAILVCNHTSSLDP